MCPGVGLFCLFSGLLAAWFIAPAEAATDSEIASLRREITALREGLEAGRHVRLRDASLTGRIVDKVPARCPACGLSRPGTVQ
jgi:hypothetical protein